MYSANKRNDTTYCVPKTELVGAILISLDAESVLALAVDVVDLCTIGIENRDIDVKMRASLSNDEGSVDVCALMYVLKKAFFLSWRQVKVDGEGESGES